MRGEQWDAVLLEELLVLVEHAVEPWEKLLGAVVGVEDDGNAVDGGNGPDVVSRGNGTSDGSFLLLSAVLDALAGKIGGATLASL